MNEMPFIDLIYSVIIGLTMGVGLILLETLIALVFEVKERMEDC